MVNRKCLICGKPTGTKSAYCKKHNRDICMLQRFTSRPKQDQLEIISKDERTLKLRKKVLEVPGISSVDAVRTLEYRS